MKQNADNAKQANQLAIAARDVANRGGAFATKAVKAMGETNKSRQEDRRHHHGHRRDRVSNKLAGLERDSGGCAWVYGQTIEALACQHSFTQPGRVSRQLNPASTLPPSLILAEQTIGFSEPSMRH